jgi:hypothetical protein
LAKLAQASKATREKAESTFIAPLNVALDQVRGLLKAQPVSVKTLPPDILHDWTSTDGEPALRCSQMAIPTITTRCAFAAAVLKVQPEAIGGPISIEIR